MSRVRVFFEQRLVGIVDDELFVLACCAGPPRINHRQ